MRFFFLSLNLYYESENSLESNEQLPFIHVICEQDNFAYTMFLLSLF